MIDNSVDTGGVMNQRKAIPLIHHMFCGAEIEHKIIPLLMTFRKFVEIQINNLGLIFRADIKCYVLDIG